MSARYRHERMTGRELSRQLGEIGLTVRQFSRLTGVQPRTMEKYLHDPAAEVPHWIRVFLDLLRDPSNMTRALEVTEEVLLDEGEDA